MRGAHSTSRVLAVVVAGVATAGVATVAQLVDLLPGLEQQTVAQRFQHRSATQPRNLLVVAIDDKTIGDLGMHWPFARRLHARVIDRLTADRARAIVYNVQFTEPTDTANDNALIRAVERANNVVLATSETDAHGHTNVFGGDDVVASVGARVGASNLPQARGGSLQRVEYAHARLRTLATVTAAMLGRALTPARFPHGGAWIDYRGPPGTVDTVSFSDLLSGRVDPARVRGRIVVVGASSPTLQDLHPTPTGDGLMSGPEVQANAIDTALRGLPLRAAPGWAGLLVVLGMALAPALISLRLRPLAAALAAPLVAAAFLVVAQYAFGHGLIVPVAVPLFALSLGTMATITAGYAAERFEHKLTSRRSRELERAVSERTAELRDTQLEVIERLAQATESRDEDTGAHLHHMSALCERVGLQMGMTAAEAETLRNASLLHDVGKIGLPDAILHRRGALSSAERELMQRHAAVGAQLLSGSRSEVMRMAEQIALTHHERWDGGGYPQGLAGEEIPLPGRICAVCDVFDALLSSRPYKPPWRPEVALGYLRRERGRHFDPAVVDAFMRVAEHDPTLLELGAEPAEPGAPSDVESGPVTLMRRA